MIVNKYNNGNGGGGTGSQGPQGPAGAGDSGQVQTQIENAINAFSQDLQDGDPIVGMAAQLYSPDGVESQGTFAYRTTAGDADVATGDAELRVLKGNSDYNNVSTSYEVSADLLVSGEPVEDFTYEILEDGWVEFVDTAQTASLKPMSAKTMTLIDNGQDWIQFKVSPEDDIDKAPLKVNVSNGTYSFTIWDSSICTAVTQTKWSWSRLGAEGYMEFTDNMLYIWVTDCQEGQYLSDIYWHNSADTDIYAEYEEIPAGESTYYYGADGWSPELPAQLTDMEINGSAYVPSLDDEIVIYNDMVVAGKVVYPQPSQFVALGLNSFDYTCDGLLTTKDDDCKVYYDAEDNDGKWGGGTGNTGYTTYFVKAVTGLEDGYVIHSPNGVLEFGVGLSPADNFDDAVSGDNNFDYTGMETISANTTYVVYPTTAMPYIVFSVAEGDETDVCVHPRWSGKMDNGFEEYTESIVDLSGLDCPLYSIGNYKNEIDLKNGVFKQYVETEEFDADNLAYYLENGYTLGTNIAYDENYIYLGVDEPTETEISADYAYQDNDFSVEYFVAIDPDTDGNMLIPIPVYAETYYITNLVDKLRRLESDFVHIDSPDTEGETGKTYEYQGRLMKWVEGSGYTAEWLGGALSNGDNQGNGFIFATIPEGQKLFDWGYYSNEKTSVYYRGGKLVDVTTGGTERYSVSVGNTFDWNPNGNTSHHLYGIYKNGYIGLRGTTSLLRFENIWSGKVSDSHYELIDKYNYPYTLNANTTQEGIPVYNDKGQVVKRWSSVGTKDIQFNTNASQYSNTGKITIITNGTNNGPSRIFVPTEGGTAGQVLLSNGDNAAPTFQNWIKVVKITSDDYEALTTKDPNVLYLIDDE